MSDIILDQATAVRTWKKGKATVTITLPESNGARREWTMGGSRAARAEGVFIGEIESQLRAGTYVDYGCRGTLEAAQAEVARMLRGRPGCTPHAWAAAIPVVDA